MIFVCDKKNFDVSVGIRNLGRPIRKFIHFDENGEVHLNEKDDMEARLIERLKGELKTGSIPGLKIKTTTKKTTKTKQVQK